MHILNLKEAPSRIQQLAEWHHSEWSHLCVDGRLETRLDKMASYLGDDFVPTTFIGEKDGELVGSAAIIKCDMHTHENLSPWLASVYVSNDFRKNGYGASLVRHVMEKAKEQGILKLYLYTPSEEEFYSRLGWIKKSEENYMGETVIIMEVSL